MGKAEALRAAVAGAVAGGANALLAVTLAPRCAACAKVLDAPLAGPVCPACWGLVRRLAPPLCRRCGDPLPSWRVVSIALEQCPRCRRRPPLVDRGCSAGEYEGALREIVHAFKYEGRRSLARPLGGLLRSAGADLLKDADCLVPVPLHPWRRVRRGFNQASELAHHLDLPVIHALWRWRPTPAQTGLSAPARRRNVRGAFGIAPLRSRGVHAALDGRVVVLVDDVRTTGATLDECALVLKDAGARDVRAMTVARAFYKRDATAV
ncbi:MAG: ComF family protein [Acidimicrobiia bacterium]|nr:ComF family protein [Acidimicrobiia bacterium]